MNDKTTPLRLAFRREGGMWTAYLAQVGTMEGAFLIGSIAIGWVEQHPELKEGFMGLMKQAVDRALVDIIGRSSDYWHEPTPAPESERSGNA